MKDMQKEERGVGVDLYRNKISIAKFRIFNLDVRRQINVHNIKQMAR